MRTKMTLGFKRGTKVVPKSKSVWAPLEESEEWIKAKEKNQPYLYVAGEVVLFDEKRRCLVLSNIEDAEDGGDFFLPSDVKIYKEDNLLQYEVWYAENDSNTGAQKIRPEVAQFLVGALDGKCNFLLLPKGQLVLRVYVKDYGKYEFYTLPKENFFAKIKEKETDADNVR